MTELFFTTINIDFSALVNQYFGISQFKVDYDHAIEVV